MPELATKALGVVEVNPMQIISFPEGLYGFREYAEYALLEEQGESVFKWLQSTQEATLAFVLIQPELFVPDYRPELLPPDLEALAVKVVADCIVFSIVTIPEQDPEKMTANLQGPILINKDKKIGRQIISADNKHMVRTPILEYVAG